MANEPRLLLLLTAAVASAAPVEDPRGFRFEVPSSFEAQPDVMPGARTWRRGALGTPTFGVITVTGLGGTIAQAPADHAIVESSARAAAAPSGVVIDSFTYRTLVWQDLELEVLESHARTNDLEVIQLTVQLPFAGEAIQVSLLGMAANEVTLRTDFDAFVSSFDGTVTWKSAAQQRDRALGEGIGAGCGLVLVLAFPVAAWVLFRKPKRTAPEPP